VTSLTRGQPNFARCLAVSWARTVYIHFRGLLSPNGILPAAKFTLHPSLALSYIGSVSARHSSSGHQPNLAAWYKSWKYWTFAEGATCIRHGGQHVGYQPTVFLCYFFSSPNLSRRRLDVYHTSTNDVALGQI